MKDERTGIDRRKFISTGIQAAAGAMAFGAGAARGAMPKNKTIPSPGAIPARPFGKTGHVLPILGHGGSAMVDSWSSAYNVQLESHDKRIEMVRHGYERGIRYFDTARVYGESERIMGEALKDVRDNIFLATKVAAPNPDYCRGSVEKSMQDLQTDYLDCVQIHSPAIERVGAKEAMKIYEELEKMRGEGMIRFIGLTTHVAFEDVYEMIDTGAFDQVLLARGYIRKGMDTMLSNRKIEWSNRCMARAHELGMAIVAMKVMGLNMLGRGSTAVVPEYEAEKRRKMPAAAIRWILQDERISMLNIGISVREDIDENVATLTGDTSFTDDDSLLLAEYSARVYESDYVRGMETA